MGTRKGYPGPAPPHQSLPFHMDHSMGSSPVKQSVLVITINIQCVAVRFTKEKSQAATDNLLRRTGKPVKSKLAVQQLWMQPLLGPGL